MHFMTLCNMHLNGICTLNGQSPLSFPSSAMLEAIFRDRGIGAEARGGNLPWGDASELNPRPAHRGNSDSKADIGTFFMFSG